MPIEHETKILGIDLSPVRAKLTQMAARTEPRTKIRRWVYHLPKPEPAAWVRILYINGKTILSFKQFIAPRIDGMMECEFEVLAPPLVVGKFLVSLGCTAIATQDNYNERFTLSNGVMVDIEEWPKIPPYLEIEGSNADIVKQTVIALGFNPKDSQPITTSMVYQHYGLDLHSFKVLTFD